MKKLVTTFTVLLLVFFSAEVFSQSAGDYRSAAAGDWSSAATWETFDGANWVAAGSAPTGSENITVDDSVNVDGAVNVTGYITVEGSGKVAVGAGSLSFDNGSTYEHAVNGGDIPAATWGTGSTCLVTGVTSSSPNGSNQDFYNFTWDCASQSSNLDVSWSGNTIGGNVTCANTGGTNQFRLTSSGDYTDSITINGDVIVSGGVLTSTGSSTAMSYSLFVNGDITVTAGSFALSRGSGGLANWTLMGDLSVSNAELRTSNNSSKFIFTAADTQQVSFSSVTYTGTVNYDVDSGAAINIIDGPDTVDVTVNGTLTNINGIVMTEGVLSFENGSVYNHARDGGSIPTAIWRTGSTCQLTGITGITPSNGNQNFHNFTWNCPNQGGNRNLGWDNITIGGDITILSTGSGRWQMTAPITDDSATVTIMGDVIQSAGNFTTNGTSNGNTTIVINQYGDVNVTGGNFSVSRGSQSGTGSTNWNLFGENFSLTDATTQNSNPGGATFVFAGTTTQNLTLNNVTVTSLPVRVAPGAILNLGTSQIGGSGEFRVNAGATLETANAGGLDSAIQSSAVNILDTAANYTFNGTVAQITGSLLPVTVNDLTVNNSAGVTLSDDVKINGNLDITDGDLNLNGNTITLGSSAMLNETAGNTVTGNTGKITTTRDINAPAGDNVGGLGAMFTSSADLGSTVIERFHSAAAADGNEGIFRQYSISPTNNSGLAATLRFYYDESELNGISEANLTLFKSPNGTNSWVDNGGVVNETDNYVELTGIGAFSYWTLGDVGNPLPVELVSFSASADGRFVTLSWITASELNNQGWEIERRIKNEENSFSDWKKVGFLAGTGNNTSLITHSYKDQSVTFGSYQYRLKQIDLDGSFGYSNIASVDLNGPVEFALFQNYPNPFNPETVIRFEVPSSSFVNLTIYNTVGEKVATVVNEQMERGIYLWNFNASNLPSGVYIYRLNAGDQVFTKKMMLIK